MTGSDKLRISIKVLTFIFRTTVSETSLRSRHHVRCHVMITKWLTSNSNTQHEPIALLEIPFTTQRHSSRTVACSEHEVTGASDGSQYAIFFILQTGSEYAICFRQCAICFRLAPRMRHASDWLPVCGMLPILQAGTQYAIFFILQT
jgi:hypothetical protein